MQIDMYEKAIPETAGQGGGMVDAVVTLKTDGDLLRRIREAREPSPSEVREQRVSFAYGSLDSESSMTREQVRRLVECD